MLWKILCWQNDVFFILDYLSCVKGEKHYHLYHSFSFSKGTVFIKRCPKRHSKDASFIISAVKLYFESCICVLYVLFTEWVNPVDKHMGIILSRLETAEWPINAANYQESWHMHICIWLLSCKCIAYLKGHLDRNCSRNTRTHDDVIKWKHFPRYWPFVRGIHRSPVNSPHKGQWRGALMFSLICVWINGWVNNREAGDLRRYRAHYEVIVMTEDFASRSSGPWDHTVEIYGWIGNFIPYFIMDIITCACC